jgi:hypothetical protein
LVLAPGEPGTEVWFGVVVLGVPGPHWPEAPGALEPDEEVCPVEPGVDWPTVHPVNVAAVAPPGTCEEWAMAQAMRAARLPGAGAAAVAGAVAGVVGAADEGRGDAAGATGTALPIGLALIDRR